jgi:hypothetical protein
MYAIVKTGGKQYRVERGQTLLVERLAVDEGGNVALEPILYRSEDAVFDSAGLKKVKVQVQAQARLQASQRPSPGADAYRGHGDFDGLGGESGRFKSHGQA